MGYSKYFDIYPFDKAVDLAFKSARIKVDKVIYGSNRCTYLYYVGGGLRGRYHHFGNFRVYWAYRWSVAEGLDRRGFIRGDVNPLDAVDGDVVYSNYANRYK